MEDVKMLFDAELFEQALDKIWSGWAEHKHTSFEDALEDLTDRIKEEYTERITEEFKWTKEKLWQLRQQIPLCSLYYNDYCNNLGVEEHVCCDFFDGYSDYLGEQMEDDGHEDTEFFDRLGDYDNAENLWEWYGSYWEEPLPITEEEHWGWTGHYF